MLKFFASRLGDQGGRGLSGRPGGWLRTQPTQRRTVSTPTTELCSNGSPANSAGFVGGADGRTPRGMDCWLNENWRAEIRAYQQAAGARQAKAKPKPAQKRLLKA